MKTTELIRLLQKTHLEYGDVDILLMNEDTGNWHPIGEVLKLHPYTGQYGCMNRSEPINAIGVTRGKGNAPDLVLSNVKVETSPPEPQ